MKCLHEKFMNDMAGDGYISIDNGLINIIDRYWSAAEIIELAKQSDGTNKVFDDLFNSWLQGRLEVQTDNANQILKNYEQEERFLMLLELYKKGKVTPFIGAGMSMASGYPSWKDFLYKQQRHAHLVQSDLDSLLDDGKYEEAAETIAVKLGETIFSESIESTFLCKREVNGAIMFLPYIFQRNIVTTNFDGVLARVFDMADIKIESIAGQSSGQIRKKLVNDEGFLLMLHGFAGNIDGRILTLSEYNKHYDNGRIIKKAIKALCDSQTLLFIGCSLTIDRTLKSMQEHVYDEGADNLPRHYAFLEDPDSIKARFERQQKLSECNIYPIWYPKGTHDESIEAFLMKLYWDGQ